MVDFIQLNDTDQSSDTDGDEDSSFLERSDDESSFSSSAESDDEKIQAWNSRLASSSTNWQQSFTDNDDNSAYEHCLHSKVENFAEVNNIKAKRSYYSSVEKVHEYSSEDGPKDTVESNKCLIEDILSDDEVKTKTVKSNRSSRNVEKIYHGQQNPDRLSSKREDKNERKSAYDIEPNVTEYSDIAKTKENQAATVSIETGSTSTDQRLRVNPYNKQSGKVTASTTNNLIQQIPERRSCSVNNSTDSRNEHEHESSQHVANVPDSRNSNEIDDLWQRTLVIDPELYKPPSYNRHKPEPIIHYVTRENRPNNKRYMISVTDIFRKPVSDFWTTKFHSFNHFQSEVANKAIHSDDSIVISAPTAAGKTCIFEMAFCRLISKAIDGKQSNQGIPKHRKVLYISPSKALCEERYHDWSKRLREVDPSIEVALLTGDSFTKAFPQVASAHIILTTPEKWDSITRRWTDNMFLIGSVKLLLIDEVHMLGDEQRGARLESIICRMKTVQRAAQSSASYQDDIANYRIANTTPDALSSNMRIVAVSATLPNISDIASFLDVNEAFSFDESFRPVSLQTHVVGLGYKGKNQYLFEKNLDRHIPDLLKRFSEGKPTIIFCHTKKETERLALDLSSSVTLRQGIQELDRTKFNTNSAVLLRCLKSGVAFHHAGMEAENRHMVESAFASGIITYLCATSTLAMGVNLPAHLVIIKGTSAWRGSGQGHQDIDIGTILQMIGRAGRPGYDSSGVAVIMTDLKSKQRYENLSSGLDVVESNLLDHLIETVNTEISQRVITNIQQAIDWLKGTFFFRCVKRNPAYYGLSGKSELDRESYLMRRCMESLQELHNSKIIHIRDNMVHVSPEEACHVMSHHMVPYESMRLIMGLEYDSGPLHLLQALSRMKGIQFPVRKAEKTLLNEAHKAIKYKLTGQPSKVRVQTPEEKAFVLLQVAIGQYYLEDYTLRQEVSITVEYATRMLTAIEDFSIKCSRHGIVALESLLLRRALATSLWSSNDGVLNQIHGVGQKTGKKLFENGIKTFTDVLSHSSNEIEQTCGRQTPFGQELRAAVSRILHNSLSLSAHLDIGGEETKYSILTCTLKKREDATNQKFHNDDGLVNYTLAVHTDRPGGSIMFRSILEEGSHTIPCPKSFSQLHIRLVSNLVGMDEQLAIDGSEKMTKPTFKVSPKQIKTTTEIRTRNSAEVRRVKEANLIQGSNDVCLHSKEGSASKIKLDTNSSSTVTATPAISLSRKRRRDVSSDCEIVTPSPLPSTKTPWSRAIDNSAMYKSDYNTQCMSKDQGGPTPHQCEDDISLKPSTPSRAIVNNEAKSLYNDSNLRQGQHLAKIKVDNLKSSNRTLWSRSKQEQASLQQRAFRTSNENPFNSFKYDPNCAERQLEIESASSVLSRTTFSVQGESERSKQGCLSRFRVSGNTIARTPTAHIMSVPSRSLRRMRVGTSSFRMSNQDLLRLKADEQQLYTNNYHYQQSPFLSTRAPTEDISSHYNSCTARIQPLHLSHYSDVAELPENFIFPQQIRGHQDRMIQAGYNHPCQGISRFTGLGNRTLHSTSDPWDSALFHEYQELNYDCSHDVPNNVNLRPTLYALSRHEPSLHRQFHGFPIHGHEESNNRMLQREIMPQESVPRGHLTEQYISHVGRASDLDIAGYRYGPTYGGETTTNSGDQANRYDDFVEAFF